MAMRTHLHMDMHATTRTPRTPTIAHHSAGNNTDNHNGNGNGNGNNINNNNK